MIIFTSLLTAAAGAAVGWSQPSYWEVFQAVRSNSDASWGFPGTDGRKLAFWSTCPTLETPEGASAIACDQSTCAVICKPGFLSTGRRRVRCRWNRKKGFHWNKELSTCSTCDPAEPEVSLK